jgi:glycosidase
MISNHDYGVGRITDRIKDEKELYEHAILNILLPGIPFIYYGDEIGMVGKLKYRYEEYSPSYYDTLYRTMMPWNEMYVESKLIENSVVLDDKYIIEECATVGTIYGKTINEQLNDIDNLYMLYKGLINIRNKYKDIFYYGNVEDIYENGFSICYNDSKLRVTIGNELGNINTKYFSIKVEMCGE